MDISLDVPGECRVWSICAGSWTAIRLPHQSHSVLRTQVVQAESRGSAHPSPGLIQPGDSERTGGERRPRTCNLRHPNHAHPAFLFSFRPV